MCQMWFCIWPGTFLYSGSLNVLQQFDDLFWSGAQLLVLSGSLTLNLIAIVGSLNHHNWAKAFTQFSLCKPSSHKHFQECICALWESAETQRLLNVNINHCQAVAGGHNLFFPIEVHQYSHFFLKTTVWLFELFHPYFAVLIRLTLSILGQGTLQALKVACKAADRAYPTTNKQLQY